MQEEEIACDPVHDLALLERKPGALDAARPLAEWKLPECFALLCRRLESGQGAEGTREYIRVLRLLETHRVERLAKAVNEALEMGATSRDLIAQLLRPPEDILKPGLMTPTQLYNTCTTSRRVSEKLTM